MKKYLYICIILMSLNILNAQDLQKLVWPPAPDEAKIEYVTSVRKSEDLGIEKGFFSKAYDFIFGDEDPSINAPFGLHADKTRVYVTDIASKAVYIFDKKEEELIILEAADNERFLYPLDVTTDSKGNIFVSDSVRAKIYVFESDGDFSYTIAPKQLKRCVGIAISPDDKKLYIVDALSSQIHVTTLKGKYLHSIGKKGDAKAEFNRPTFIDVSKDGKIYVTDSMNHRIQILDGDGNYLHSFGRLGQNIGDFGSPRGISLDADGNIYVSDTMFNNIQIFNQSGELLLVLGGFGGREGEFALPEDIAILGDGSIYIADTNNKRVQLLKKIDIAKIRSSK